MGFRLSLCQRQKPPCGKGLCVLLDGGMDSKAWLCCSTAPQTEYTKQHDCFEDPVSASHPVLDPFWKPFFKTSRAARYFLSGFGNYSSAVRTALCRARDSAGLCPLRSIMGFMLKRDSQYFASGLALFSGSINQEPNALRREVGESLIPDFRRFSTSPACLFPSFLEGTQ